MAEKIRSCLAALNALTVTGRQNCFIVAAVSNDLEEILHELERGETHEDPGKRSDQDLQTDVR